MRSPDVLVARCYDYHVIRAILTHPAIYDRISEDGTSLREDFIPDIVSAAYIIGIVGPDPIGIVIYRPVNGVTWECHVQVLPDCRKEHADEFARKAIEWAWDMDTRKLVVQVPFLYPTDKDFVLRQGFVLEGVNRQSYLKNGQLHDQWYMGLMR